MRVLITGICGFVGSALAKAIALTEPSWQVFGIDNFSRTGSRTNKAPLEAIGIPVHEIDLRDRAKVLNLDRADWVIDCAANPSVLAGIDAGSSSQSVMDHNLLGTIHALEYCKQHQAGFVLLSTSRVYSVQALSSIKCVTLENRFSVDQTSIGQGKSIGLSTKGIAENFSVTPPLSLYGVSKLASELVALEYASAFDFPLWIDRCGVMAGAGQFGKADQGIVAYWLHSYLHRRRLKYIGFEGLGHQVRDCLHPSDLWNLIRMQIATEQTQNRPKIVNVSGGTESSFSLKELTEWCLNRWKDSSHAEPVQIASESTKRAFDCPWIVLDSSLARSTWTWEPTRSLNEILNEVADHAEANADWLTISGA